MAFRKKTEELYVAVYTYITPHLHTALTIPLLPVTSVHNDTTCHRHTLGITIDLLCGTGMGLCY